MRVILKLCGMTKNTVSELQIFIFTGTAWRCFFDGENRMINRIEPSPETFVQPGGDAKIRAPDSRRRAVIR